MEETYIQLYNINNKGIKWFVYFSFLLLSYGIFSLTGLLWFEEIVFVQHAPWLSSNFILQALVLLVVMYYAKTNADYRPLRMASKSN